MSFCNISINKLCLVVVNNKKAVTFAIRLREMEERNSESEVMSFGNFRKKHSKKNFKKIVGS